MNVFSDNEAKCLMEAGLFVAGENGLTLSDFCNLLQKEKTVVQTLLEELKQYYLKNETSPFELKVLDNKYKLLTKACLNKALLRLAHIKYKNPLSKTLMEVLAIIAYNSPITKKEIEKIKPCFKKVKVNETGQTNLGDSTSCDYALQRLRELELVEMVVIKKERQNQFAYKVTGKFLDVFGLKSIRDLPKINREKLNAWTKQETVVKENGGE